MRTSWTLIITALCLNIVGWSLLAAGFGFAAGVVQVTVVVLSVAGVIAAFRGGAA